MKKVNDNTSNQQIIKLERRYDERPSYCADANGLLKGKWDDFRELKTKGPNNEAMFEIYYDRFLRWTKINEHGFFYNIFSCKKYDGVLKLSDDLFICEKNGRLGIINNKEKTILHTCYNNIKAVNSSTFLVDTETGNANYGTSVSPNTKSYTGFTSPQRQTKTITSTDNIITYEYTRNTYTLTINPQGGTTSTELNQELKYGASTQIVSPTKRGYNFTGWTKTSGTLQDTTFTMGASNATLTANYQAKTITIYFDANQGSVTQSSKTVTYDSTYGTLPTPTREGYTFDGWYVNGEKITSNTTVNIENTTSAVAHWSKGTYVLSVNPNGGTYNSSSQITTTSMDFEEEVTISDPTREGYTFNGWTLEGTSATYNSSTKVFKMGSSNATLTAKWTINKYKLTIEGTNVCDGEFNLDYQETKTLCEPENEGHTFAGWEDEDSLIQNNVVTMKAKNSVIRAKWTVNTYNYIVYHNKMNLDGTTYTRVDADTYNGTGEFGTVIVTESKNYTGFKTQTNKSITIGVSNNTVEYNYEREKYTLTINPSGGEYSGQTSLSLYYEEQTTLGNISKTGYNFSGWSATTGEVSDNKYTMPASNATLTANYTPKTYTVTFNANGGSVTTSSKTVTYDSTYGELPTPIRTNYDFLGWYTEEENGTKVESTNTVKIENNQTLYAHWRLQAVTITFDANGGSVTPTSTEITKGGKISELPIPTRDNYTFMGWYDTTNCTNKITTSTTFNTNQTLYAHWLPSNGVSFVQGLPSCYESNLLTDGTADNNLRYVGADPNNYVKFNNELWRIVGVMNNIQTSSGQSQSLLKIRRANELGRYSWDTTDESIDSASGINQWGESGTYTGSDLMRELNYDYLGNVVVGTDGYWYNGQNDQKDSAKPESTISIDEQNKIENVVWNLGAITTKNGIYDEIWDNEYNANMSYTRERLNEHGKTCNHYNSCNDDIVRTTTWTGKVAIIYPSDYLYATTGGSTVSRNTCLTAYGSSSYGESSYSECKDNDWMLYTRFYQWALSPGGNDAYQTAFYIDTTGKVSYSRCSYIRSIFPVVHLKSSVSIIGGEGTQANPYILG